MTMQRCAEPGCTGRILADGYCDTCGTKAPDPVAAPAAKAPAKGVANPTATATPATRSVQIATAARRSARIRASMPS